MAPTSDDLEKSALTTLQTALEHQHKSNDRAELSCLNSAAVSLLSVSVSRFDRPDIGIDYLRSLDVDAVIRRIANLNRKLYLALLNSDGPPTTAVDNRITPIHIGWLLHEWDASDILLRICTDDRVTRYFPLTKFWAEYHRAIHCYVSRQLYDPAFPKLRGYEKCWVPYLNLISDLTYDRVPSNSLNEIAEMFSKRNRDKRLTDWEMIDGDGNHPVQWDFREASILEYREFAPKNVR